MLDGKRPIGEGFARDRRESFATRLAGGVPLVGCFVQIPSPEVVEVIGLAGFDFAIIDMEHGCYGLDPVRQCLRACEVTGLGALCRVPELSVSLIARVLDLGAEGVVVPMVRTGQGAAEAVRAGLYPPAGVRGYCSAVRAAGYLARPGTTELANERTMVIPLVEDVTGAANFEDIVATPGLKAVFLGPGDLACSMGLTGQLAHPSVTGEVERLLDICSRHGVAAGVHVRDLPSARNYVSKGASFLTCGIDAQFLARAAAQQGQDFRAACQEAKLGGSHE